jgi:hypothetical protein
MMYSILIGFEASSLQSRMLGMGRILVSDCTVDEWSVLYSNIA